MRQFFIAFVALSVIFAFGSFGHNWDTQNDMEASSYQYDTARIFPQPSTPDDPGIGRLGYTPPDGPHATPYDDDWGPDTKGW